MRFWIIISAVVLAEMIATSCAIAHPCLCNGDANLDGVFNEADFQFTLDCLGQQPVDVCTNADINCDGFINTDDIDPEDPFGGDTAIVCLWNGTPPEECCPGHVPCGTEIAGDCFESNGNPACNDLDCCILVCLSDPFCCDFLWDEFCAAFAAENCEMHGNCADDASPVIDISDFNTFAACSTGPFPGKLPEGCDCADFDGDLDADLLDFGAFQIGFSNSQ